MVLQLGSMKLLNMKIHWLAARMNMSIMSELNADVSSAVIFRPIPTGIKHTIALGCIFLRASHILNLP